MVEVLPFPAICLLDPADTNIRMDGDLLKVLGVGGAKRRDNPLNA